MEHKTTRALSEALKSTLAVPPSQSGDGEVSPHTVPAAGYGSSSSSGAQSSENELQPEGGAAGTSSSFNRRPPSDTPLFSPRSASDLSRIPITQPSSSGSSRNNSHSNSPRSTSSIPPLHLSSQRRAATTLDVPGLTRSKISPDGMIAARDLESKLVIVMVGLPARGKSYVTKKLCRYLNWQQHGARIFNVGNTRRNADRTVGPASRPLPDEGVALASPEQEAQAHAEHEAKALEAEMRGDPPDHTDSADFFSPDNAQTSQLREKWAMDTLDELLDYILNENGSVGVLDATNTTRARRKKVLDRIRERTGGRLKVLFLESICTRSDIIDANIRLKLSGPDYKDMDQEKALKDFVARLHNYEKVYETISDEEEEDDNFQYIKMIDVGRKVVCYNIQGFLAGQAVFFLLNFNLAERQIWITRHGESEDNAAGRIGGDAPLTARGEKFAKALARFMDFQKSEFRRKQLQKFTDRVRILKKEGSAPSTPLNEPEEPNFCVWTSMMKRSVQTAQYMDEDMFAIKEVRMLNELGAGVCEGMTYEEISQTYPEEYAARIADKIQYRYPGIGGESYLDVINRLRPVIVEMERMEDNALIIAHRVVARVLLAYFMNLGRDAIGDLDVPLHTLYMLEPKPYGVDWAVYEYSEETDWFYRVPKEQISAQIQRLQRESSQKRSNRGAPAVIGTGTALGSTKERNFSVVPTQEDAAAASAANNISQLSLGASSAPSSRVPLANRRRRPSAVDDIQVKQADYHDWETAAH